MLIFRNLLLFTLFCIVDFLLHFLVSSIDFLLFYLWKRFTISTNLLLLIQVCYYPAIIKKLAIWKHSFQITGSVLVPEYFTDKIILNSIFSYIIIITISIRYLESYYLSFLIFLFHQFILKLFGIYCLIFYW